MRQLLVCLLVVFAEETGSLSVPSKSIRALPTWLLATADDAAVTATSPPAAVETPATAPPKPVSVLVCPAQFCVPADYEQFLATLHTKLPTTLRSATTVPLPRTEWIQVAKQLPTTDYIQGTLPVEETLRWYFNAMEQALLDLLNNDDGDGDTSTSTDICIIGHSIGGWIARAYLGGLSQSSSAVYRAARQRVRSLVTLGTPHQPSGAADQTRGLIRAVAAAASCTPAALAAEAGIRVTCVGSRAVEGGWDGGPEGLLAWGSYGSFAGDFAGVIVGDGIVPLESSLLEAPAERVVLDTPRHLHVLPTPWNLWDGYQPSIPLLDVPHYLSDDVVDQWIDYL